MIYYCWLFLLLVAKHSGADVFKLFESSNGFLYDVPLTSDLSLQPLDATIDEKTHLAFGSQLKILNSYKQLVVAPGVATRMSLPKQVSRHKPRHYAHNWHRKGPSAAPGYARGRRGYALPATSSKTTGYSYHIPPKPFFID